MALNNAELLQIGETLERLEKSFNAIGYPNANMGGQTGITALARMSMDPVMHSIAANDENFKLIKGLKKEKATNSIHQYRVKTAVGTAGMDFAGVENFLPQEDQGQYEKVVEPLKVYGVRKVLGEMVELIGEAGGLEVDPDKENEINAISGLTQQFERDGYQGGDYYLDRSTGLIDVTVPLVSYGRGSSNATRSVRGIQSNIREGNVSTRGISGDFAAYGNSFATTYDFAGAAMDQDSIDDIVTAVASNGQGVVREAHAIASAIAEFRKQLFPHQRGDMGSKFSVQGPDVSNVDEGFNVLSVSGVLKFIPCVYKNAVRQKAIAVGNGPIAPVVSAIASAAVSGVTSPYAAGDTVRVVVQSVNIQGISTPTAVSCTVTNAGEAAKIRIVKTALTETEYWMIFANDALVTTVGREGFVGKVVNPSSVATGGNVDIFLTGAVRPGFESIVFLPTDENRMRMATLGNMINRTELGQLGTFKSTIFTSYFCFVLPKPRCFALADNAKARRRPN